MGNAVGLDGNECSTQGIAVSTAVTHVIKSLCDSNTSIVSAH